MVGERKKKRSLVSFPHKHHFSFELPFKCKSNLNNLMGAGRATGNAAKMDAVRKVFVAQMDAVKKVLETLTNMCGGVNI